MTLELEAAPRNVALARMFVASAVHESGLDDEAIDDIKIAVSEAVTFAMARVSPAGHIRVRLSPVEGAVACSVEPVGDHSATTERDPMSADIGAAIIAALFSDAVLEATGTVGFTIPLSRSDSS